MYLYGVYVCVSACGGDYLSSVLILDFLTHLQSQGILATVKHFADNNQEYNRTTVSEAPLSSPSQVSQ